jgi:hypothetical protein
MQVVQPILKTAAIQGYSSRLHENILAELTKLGQETAHIRRFEINWAVETLGLKRKLAKLQFDTPPPRTTWIPGKSQLQSALRDFIYPAVLDILFYTKNKGNEADQSPMPELERLHKQVLKIRKEGFEKMVLITHSLGTVAGYDYVFRFEERYPFPAGLELSCFVTFGSPIALFASGMGYPISVKIKRPAYAKKWINLWDWDDPIATRLEPHFPAKFKRGFLKDIAVDTHLFNPVAAHENYWNDAEVSRHIALAVAQM